ncbi:MAG: 50S ribosomal protein L18 [uncultured bacterium]|nr:MAG: 50S ribosomal protein L18 [uncultured bacterium]
MIKKPSRNELRLKRHERDMKKLKGTAEKPRLSVFKSLKHIYVQVTNDDEEKTLFGMGTVAEGFGKDGKKNMANKENAKELGKKVAEECLKRNISKVVFDRSGYKYHGKIKVLTDAAREAGLVF